MNGIRPQDLVGAIANESDLSGRDIGAIEIGDRFSLVEVPEAACIRLDRWYRSQEASRLALALHETLVLRDEEVEEGAEAGAVDVTLDSAVIADLFLRFVPCERGKTPAFAAGPFDALDAVQGSVESGAQAAAAGYGDLALQFQGQGVSQESAMRAIPSLEALRAKQAQVNQLAQAQWQASMSGTGSTGTDPLGDASTLAALGVPTG